MALYTQDNGMKISEVDMVKSSGQMEPFFKEIIDKIRKMD
jgi:hypothetical protein